jgi:hypothetical protein
MSDVNFRNLKDIPLQDGFTQSSVFKISAASKIFAAAVGIISICVFIFTDGAKTSITTIETTNLGNCRILSTFSASGLTIPVTVAEGKIFKTEFIKLLKSLPGTQIIEMFSPENLIPDLVSRLGLMAGSGLSYPLAYNQAYFPSYQSCLDAFTKPPVCVYENDYTSPFYKDQSLQSVIGFSYGNFLPNFCSSHLACLWSDAPKVTALEHGMKIILNVTAFNCNPPANFTTCHMISSACPEYSRYAASIGKLLTTHIATPERLCAPFKDLPPFSCQTFQVASPIQVISQTLSLMATALAGCEVFLYFVLTFKHKYQSLAKVHSDTQPDE